VTCKILQGDSREIIKGLADRGVNCIVTSPPYFGLRDYGHEAQIGIEQSPDEYVGQMVEVFRECRRVLRDDGTLWLNLGDSYATQGGSGRQGQTGQRATRRFTAEIASSKGVPDGLKSKDLIGIPWRVALALQTDGWYLRQDIIWHKPNPMPESVTDRCTKAHEYIFLLSKSERYYFDYAAIKERTAYPHDKRRPLGSKGAWQIDGRQQGENGGGRSYDHDTAMRNKRSVWTVTTTPFKGAHFATFPPDLIQPCILAGCPRGGEILDPFGGAGTTGMVAERDLRNSILIELPHGTRPDQSRRWEGGMRFAGVEARFGAAVRRCSGMRGRTRK
jgi:site-specific DNA-methyltransferase (adenine-specific)